MSESSNDTPREEKPWIEIVKSEDSDSKIFINRNDFLIQEVAKSLGKELVMRVDEEGNVLSLEGNAVDISKAYVECIMRVKEMADLLNKGNKNSK